MSFLTANVSGPYEENITAAWFEVTFPLLTGSVITIINTVTLLAILCIEKTQHSLSLLIASLCVSDALSGLILIVRTFPIFWDLSERFCSFGYFLYHFFSNLFDRVSQLTTLCMSVDRLVAVQFALTYHSRMTPSRLRLLVAAPWVVGLLEAGSIGYIRVVSLAANREMILRTSRTR